MDLSRKIEVTAWDIPSYRQAVATHYKVEKNFAFITFGGLGDVLCTEPTVRYTAEVLAPKMGIKSISVITRFPDLFKHLPVIPIQAGEDGLIDIEGGPEKYHFLYCGHPDGNLQNQFFTHNSMMPIDYPALSALRTQLPINYRYIKAQTVRSHYIGGTRTVVIHPGNHWKSKTFPKSWWDGVIHGLIQNKIKVIVIGGAANADPGTVDVGTYHEDIQDLRCKLTVHESAGLLKEAPVLITNDSFPLHLATIGNCHIGFLATAKDPEWLYHWRKTPDKPLPRVEFGWRMENLAKGGSYQRSFTPRVSSNHLSEATQEEVRSWLPTPESVAAWATVRMPR